MRLTPETLARHRERPRPTEYQPELPNMPAPMTQNRARDFDKECKGCQTVCGYCKAVQAR